MFNKKIEKIIGTLIVFLAILKYYSVFIPVIIPSSVIMLSSLGLSTVLILLNIKRYKLIHYLFFGVLAVQFVMSRNITLLYIYYLCLALYNIDFKYILKVALVLHTAFFIILLVRNIVGISPTEYIEGRNDFGFGNPNTAFLSMYVIWTIYLALRYENLKKVDVALLGLLMFAMYSQTNTRTGLLAGIMTVIAVVLFKYRHDSKLCKYAVISIPSAITVVSIFVAIFLKGNYFLNKILSHRPMYWNAYLTNSTHGLNLFGYPSNIREILFTMRMPLDSGYMWSLYSSGIVVYMFLIIFLTVTLYILWNEDKKAEILFMISILLYCFAESVMLEVAVNFGLILMVYGMSKLDLKRLITKKKKI